MIRSSLMGATARAARGVLGWSALALMMNAAAAVVTARALSVDARGTLVAFTTIGGLLHVVTSLGSHIAIRREYLRPGATVSLRSYFSLSLKLSVAQFVGAVLLVLVLSPPAVGSSEVAVTLTLTIAVFFSSQCLDALHAVGRSKAAAAADCAGATVTLVLAGAAALYLNTLTAMLGSFAVGYVARILLTFAMLLRKGPSDVRRRWSTSAKQDEVLLARRGASFLGTSVGQAVALRGDRYIVGAVGNVTQLGVYSVAATAAELLRLPASALGQVLLQRTARHGHDKRFLARTAATTAVLGTPVAIALIVFAEPLLTIVFGPEYAVGAAALRVLVVAELILSFYLALNPVALGAGLAKASSAAGVLGALVAVIGLLALVPSYGALGASFASLLSYLAMATFIVVALLSTARADHA